MFQNLEKYFWHTNLIYFNLSDLVKKFGSSPFSLTDKSHINQVCMHDPSSLSNCNVCFGCWTWPTLFASATWLRSFVQVHSRLLTNPTSTKYISRCISITEPSGWTSTLRDSWGTSNGSLVDFWGKLKNRSLYFYDLIRSKMSRNCILSVTELSYYYICHFYKIYRICSYAEAAFIKTIAVFTASTYWKDVFIT